MVNYHYHRLDNRISSVIVFIMGNEISDDSDDDDEYGFNCGWELRLSGILRSTVHFSPGRVQYYKIQLEHL